jgi:hypothetical protein
MPKHGDGWQLPTTEERHRLIETHPALKTDHAQSILATLRNNHAKESLAVLGHYLDYLDWLKFTRPTFTRRQIAYFSGRAERLARELRRGKVTPKTARQFAEETEKITARAWGVSAKDAPASLRAYAERPELDAARVAAKSLRAFTKNFRKADTLRTRTFFRHRRHIRPAQDWIVRFSRKLKSETGSYRDSDVEALLHCVREYMKVGPKITADWLRQLRSNRKL